MKFNLKSKIILPAVGVCVILSAFMLIYSVVQFNGYVDYSMGYRIRLMENILMHELEDAASFTNITAREAASNFAVINAFQLRDADLLYTILSDRKDFDRDIYYTVIDVNGIVLLRTHDPTVFGDSKAELSFIQQSLAGETNTVNEMGSILNVSVRSNTPIFDGNRNVIGVLSSTVRLDYEDYLDSMQQQYGIDFLIYQGNQVVASTLINNQRLTGAVMDSQIYQAIYTQRSSPITTETEILGIPYNVFYFPLLDSDGMPFAVIMAGLSAQTNVQVINSMFVGMVLITLFCVFIAVVAMALVARQITLPVNHLVAVTRELRHGNPKLGNIKTKLPNDEIGVLTTDIYRLADIIRGLTEEIQKFSYMLITEGDIEYRIQSDKYENTYKEMMDGINDFLTDFADDMLYFIQSLSNLHNGDFDVEIRTLPGKKIILPNTINEIKTILIEFNEEILTLAQNAAIGNLKSKVDESKYTGHWNEIASTLNNLLRSVEEPLIAIESSLVKMENGEFRDAYINSDYSGIFDSVKRTLNDTSKTVLSYIDEIAATLNAMSTGDLTATTKLNFIGSYQPIKEAITTIQRSLNQILSDIQDSSEKVAMHSAQIKSSAQYLAEGSQMQTSSIQEISASVSTIYEKAQQSNESTKTVNDNTNLSKEYAQNGNQAVQIMTDTMNKIKLSSDGIANIIGVITDISFQTNLLALNASVEAARAGEHGKGFSVVAEEVRSLAGRSQNSAADTAKLIEESSASVGEGIKATEEVVSAFESIAQNIAEIADVISHISTTSQEQLEIISNVNSNVTEIAKVVTNNSASAEESAASAEELNVQAELLRNKVGFFKLK
ncbi:MAG: methyl-accepting chemotaxis protein [Firmicutes bacterium]|nr:methyl-accepting chemotaxis protein [Bacillota bacterium]